MKKRMTVASTLVIALVLTPGLAEAAAHSTPPDPSQQTASPDGQQRILLARDQQPKVQRPTLYKLSQAAKATGSSLRKELDKYAAEVAAANPASLGDTPDGPVSDPSIQIDNIPYEELVDLSRLAETKGISFEDAIDRYAWIPKLQAIRAKLADSHPEDIAEARAINNGRGARIGFKGKIPDIAIELAKTLPVEVEIIGNKGFSKKELREVVESRSRELGARAEIAGFKGGYDIDTGTVTFKVELRKSLKGSPNQDEVLSALKITEPANPRVRISVEPVDSTNIQPTDGWIRGGGIIDESTPGPGGLITNCTSAFNVISASGVKGTTTAKHCADAGPYFTYNNHASHATTQATLGRMFRTPDFDIARFETGSTTMSFTRTFFYGRNRTRYVRANGTSPEPGDPVCAFGRNSDQTDGAFRCGEVVESDVPYEEDGVTYYGNILTDFPSVPGDSGGPLYLGSTAWGIAAATTSDESYFAATDRINDAGGMGSSWNVWTCPTC